MVRMGPPCVATDGGTEIVWDDDVLSDVALVEIGPWFHQQSLWRKSKVLNFIYVVYHRQGPAPFGLEPQDIPLSLDGFAITVKQCYDVGCRRCGSGPPWDPICPAAGGYRFQWSGPWTNDSMVQPGFTAREWRLELRRRATIRRETYLARMAEARTSPPRARPGGA